MAFEVVPVLDLAGGLVVHARAGERERYAPLTGSVLADRPQPLTVLAGLLKLYPFRTVYVADLDAIQGGMPQTELLRQLEVAFPEVNFWVDAGFAQPEAVACFLSTMRGGCVLGSESQKDSQLLATFAHHPRIILSLDYRGDERLGPPELFDRPDLWPSRIIVMTLARVGTRHGPDLLRLQAIRGLAPQALIYAAGGVRDLGDLQRLADLGCAGALVATALHDGSLDARALAQLRRPASGPGSPSLTPGDV